MNSKGATWLAHLGKRGLAFVSCIGQSWLQVAPGRASEQGLTSQALPCREGCRCEPRMANTAEVGVAAQHRGLGEALTANGIK